MNPPPAPVVQSECEKKIMPPKMKSVGMVPQDGPLAGSLDEWKYGARHGALPELLLAL